MVLSRVRLIRVKLVLVNLNPINDTYIGCRIKQNWLQEPIEGKWQSMRLAVGGCLPVDSVVTPVPGSIFRPLSLTQKSGSEFSDGNIPRFCSVFQVIQAISSAKFSLVEEVDLSFNSVTKSPRTLPASSVLHLVDVW